MIGDSLTWFNAPKPASNENIADIENTLGIRFPEDFRRFSVKYSGGWPNESAFEFSDNNDTFHASASEFFTLMSDDDNNIVTMIRETEFFPVGLVPFACDGGGNYVCFDFRLDKVNPSIVFWHHGRGFADDVSFVSITFSDFIELLHKPIDD